MTTGLEAELLRGLPVPFSKLLSAITTGGGTGAVEFAAIAEVEEMACETRDVEFVEACV